MSTATVTSKGQITIPVDVRRTLGLHPGSRLAFVLNEAGDYEIRAEGISVRALEGVVRAPSVPLSLEAMDEAIASGAASSLA